MDRQTTRNYVTKMGFEPVKRKTDSESLHLAADQQTEPL